MVETVETGWVSARLLGALLLFGVLGASVGLAVFASSRPVYTATNSSFLASPADRADIGERPPASQDDRRVFEDLATSPVVLDEVISTLGLQTTAVRLAEKLTVKAADQAALRITASDPSARRAAMIANAVQSELADRAPSRGLAHLTSVETAQVPTQPSSPNAALDLTAGAGAGAGAWLLLILLRLVARPRQAGTHGTAAPSMF